MNRNHIGFKFLAVLFFVVLCLGLLVGYVWVQASPQAQDGDKVMVGRWTCPKSYNGDSTSIELLDDFYNWTFFCWATVGGATQPPPYPPPNSTATRTPNATHTRTPAATLTRTATIPVPGTATNTPTRTATMVFTPTDTMAPPPTATDTPTLTATEPEPEDTETPTGVPPATDTPVPAPTDTPTTIPTATPTVTVTVAPPPSEGFIIDHNSVALFEQIPPEYLALAQQMTVLYSDRSVGLNIDNYLNCLTAATFEAAPVYCRRGYSDETVMPWVVKNYNVYDEAPELNQFSPGPQYARPNWEYRAQMGTWASLTDNFINVILPTYADYHVVMYEFSYLNVMAGDNIADPINGFFADHPDNDSMDAGDLERAYAEYPDIVPVYWTTSLARSTGSDVSDAFNNQMREYARTHGKILMDVADIESRMPDEDICYDNRDGVEFSNGGHTENYPDDGVQSSALCQEYTSEIDGGHLGSVSGGGIRLAKAYWVLMARIAGWMP